MHALDFASQSFDFVLGTAATELEDRMMVWLRDLLGLPEVFTGCIQDTASTGILAAIVTAREWASNFAVNQKGLSGGAPMTLYCSAETHSATEKGAKIAGIGRDYVRKVPLDPDRGMNPELLAQMIVVGLQIRLTGGIRLGDARRIDGSTLRHVASVHPPAAGFRNATVRRLHQFLNENRNLRGCLLV